MSDKPKEDWSATTWDGSRRAQLRKALTLTVRERLAAMEELGELSEKLARASRVDPKAESELK